MFLDRSTFLASLPAPVAALVPDAETILCGPLPVAPFGLGAMRDVRPEAILAWVANEEELLRLTKQIPWAEPRPAYDLAAIRSRACAFTPDGPLTPALEAASALSHIPYFAWGNQGMTPQGRHVIVGGCGTGRRAFPFREILERMGCVGVYEGEVPGMGGGYLPISA